MEYFGVKLPIVYVRSNGFIFKDLRISGIGVLVVGIFALVYAGIF